MVLNEVAKIVGLCDINADVVFSTRTSHSLCNSVNRSMLGQQSIYHKYIKRVWC